ncbi:helix-turn-helix transcriptional regulator [Alteribacillus iranensis]|uniref:helix-turn-helix transcriptional regulator n=1 Tax=Alteribacillus iranensis TaxID=930128 RepID=UPI0015A691D0|nr:helix-turn-helix transcriptional regulator [Alteribacillus iranensis]
MHRELSPGTCHPDTHTEYPEVKDNVLHGKRTGQGKADTIETRAAIEQVATDHGFVKKTLVEEKAMKKPNIRLIGLRDDHDLTQAELARIIGVSQSMIAQVEAGKKDFTPKRQRMIAKTFDVTVDWLFFDDPFDRLSPPS